MGLFWELLKQAFKKKGNNTDYDVFSPVEKEKRKIEPSFSASVIKPDTKHEKAINKLCRDAIPSQNGLYPHEILMLSNAEGYRQKDNDFPNYWKYKYDIDNPQEILDKLYAEGFIRLSNLKEVLEYVRMDDIKKELSERGLDSKGRRKADLIDRLISQGNTEELESKYTNRYFRYTEKGQMEIDKNKYVPYIHSSDFDGLDIWTMNKLMNEPPMMGYKDKALRYLGRKAVEYSVQREYGLSRNNRFHMAEIYLSTNRLENALIELCNVFYLDLSGLTFHAFHRNMDKWEYESNLKHFFNYEESLLQLAPGCIELLKDIQEKFNIQDDEMNEKISKAIYDYCSSTPMHIFTKEECIEIIIEEKKKEKDIQKLNAIYKEAEKRYIEQYNQ